MNPVCFSERTDQETRDLIFELLNCLGETLEIPDNLMNSAVGLSGAAIRSVLPTMEGMVRAGIDAGFSEEQSRILVSQSFLGVAALVKEGKLPIQELKKLTPMETLTEPLVDQIFYDATAGANEKINALQQKILTENR
jgi:pyrroline-5-carboxylate reductase